MRNDFSQIKRVVVKVGSSLLVQNDNLRQNWLISLMQDVSNLLENNIEVVIVSSGAIALGRAVLGIDKVDSLPQKQALSALGQIELMAEYRDAARRCEFDVAQILLTADDSLERQRYDNLQNTFNCLLKSGIVPIVNENDSVAVDEIKIGDNDRLAARVAQIISADMLILFSDIEGLYDKNPKIYEDANFIEEVPKITKEIEEMAGGASSNMGTGGMITKIVAAKMALLSGCEVAVSSGLENGCLMQLLRDEQKYTIFRADAKLKSRKKWLSGFLEAKGGVIVNENAKKAILGQKVSLLPVGIVKITGNFKKNDLIYVKDESGNHIASGIANYDSAQSQQVIGLVGEEVKEILGISKPELIHIDNIMVL